MTSTDLDAARLQVAERRGQAFDLFLKGIELSEIAQLCGYSDGTAAGTDIRATLKILRERQYDDMDALRSAELARLDAMMAKCFEIIEERRYIYDREGNELGPDHSASLGAMKMILSIMERRAKLLGLDAPTKIGVSAVVKYELVGIDTGALT